MHGDDGDVMAIIRAKDLYAVLGVSRSATVDEINKKYKKLSIKVHPDRCKHPSSPEAMKKLNEAKRILSDGTLRERYNLTGSTNDSPPPGYGRHTHGGYRGGPTAYYSNGRAYYFDPEDIFAQFMGQRFNTGSGGGGFYYSNARRPRSDQPEDPYTPFLYLLPLLLMFLLASFASSVQSSANKVQFSLHRNDEFAHHHKTRINGIDYYVSSEFDTSIFIDESTTDSFEKEVVHQWSRWKQNECQFARSQKSRMRTTAEASKNEDSIRRAAEYPLYACKDLERVFGRAF